MLFCRFIATLQDPYKQVQYNDVLKTLQEEHRLLQDMEAALEEIKNVPSTSGRTSLVCNGCGVGFGCGRRLPQQPLQQLPLYGSTTSTHGQNSRFQQAEGMEFVTRA